MSESLNKMSITGFDPFDPFRAEALGGEFTLRPGLDSPIISQRKPLGLSNEQFRYLETRLNEVYALKPFKSLLITSAVPKEGKTFVSANLAHGLSKEGQKRVLLIDGDVRRPSIHSIFGMPNEYGFKDLLAGGSNVWKAVTKIAQSELYVMPSGKGPCDSILLPTIDRIRALLNHVRPVFDLIIFDSSPLLVASDARLLSHVTDASLLVVQYGSTPREMVLKAQEVLNGKSILGTVLNRVDLNHSSYSSYYGYVYNSSKGQTRK